MKLAALGHCVTVAGSGAAALAAVQRQTFDLVFMDMQMPDMDGLEVTRLIRERERDSGLHLPIVAMTAHVGTGFRDKCLAAKMDGYVTKPIRDNEFSQAIIAMREE